MDDCQRHPHVEQSENHPNTHISWSETARAYPNLSTFVSCNKDSITITAPITADPQLLRSTQLQAYQYVVQQVLLGITEPLRMIITRTAGTGKSFLIACLKQLLENKIKATAPTGVAAFNVQGGTLHSLRQLPTKGEFKDLQGLIAPKNPAILEGSKVHHNK